MIIATAALPEDGARYRATNRNKQFEAKDIGVRIKACAQAFGLDPVSLCKLLSWTSETFELRVVKPKGKIEGGRCLTIADRLKVPDGYLFGTHDFSGKLAEKVIGPQGPHAFFLSGSEHHGIALGILAENFGRNAAESILGLTTRIFDNVISGTNPIAIPPLRLFTEAIRCSHKQLCDSEEYRVLEEVLALAPLGPQVEGLSPTTSASIPSNRTEETEMPMIDFSSYKFMGALAANVERIALMKGVGVHDLCAPMGKGDGFIKSIACGGARVTQRTVDVLAQGLGVMPDVLMRTTHLTDADLARHGIVQVNGKGHELGDVQTDTSDASGGEAVDPAVPAMDSGSSTDSAPGDSTANSNGANPDTGTHAETTARQESVGKEAVSIAHQTPPQEPNPERLSLKQRVGENLACILRAKGIKQRTFAESLGKGNSNFVSNLRLGVGRLTDELIAQMAEELKVGTEFLIAELTEEMIHAELEKAKTASFSDELSNGEDAKRQELSQPTSQPEVVEERPVVEEESVGHVPDGKTQGQIVEGSTPSMIPTEEEVLRPADVAGSQEREAQAVSAPKVAGQEEVQEVSAVSVLTPYLAALTDSQFAFKAAKISMLFSELSLTERVVLVALMQASLK